MKKISISVVMSVYNDAKYLRESVESILKQTFKNFEFVIVDDCSNSTVASILSKYSDKRIKIIRNTLNLGLTRSLNIAIKVARGRYIARMDADDISYPTRLQEQVHFLENNPEFVLCGASADLIDENNNIYGTRMCPTTDDIIRSNLVKSNQFIHPLVMFKKDAWERVGGYDESFTLSQDYDFFLKLSRIGKVANVHQTLLKYRVGTGNISYKKMRHSLYFALRSRFRALFIYGYPKWMLVYTIIPFLSYLVPIHIKKVIINNKDHGNKR